MVSPTYRNQDIDERQGSLEQVLAVLEQRHWLKLFEAMLMYRILRYCHQWLSHGWKSIWVFAISDMHTWWPKTSMACDSTTRWSTSESSAERLQLSGSFKDHGFLQSICQTTWHPKGFSNLGTKRFHWTWPGPRSPQTLDDFDWLPWIS